MSELTRLGREQLSSCWSEIFSRLRQGLDVSPSMRLRTEGMMQMHVFLDLDNEDDVSALMCRAYETAGYASLEQEWGADWQTLFPFPQIPGFAGRAPVEPSTSD